MRLQAQRNSGGVLASLLLSAAGLPAEVRARRITTLLAFILAMTTMACTSTGGDSASGERFKGRIAAMSGPGGGNTAFIDLHANQYASQEQIDRLATILVEDGERALHKAITATEPMGWVRLGNNTRYHLRLIRSIDTPSGRIIRAITDRQIHFLEIISPLRSLDYAFGIIELQLDDKDEGVGSIIAAAKITFKNSIIEIESFGNQPYRVLNVKPTTLK